MSDMKMFSILAAATMGLATIMWAADGPLPFRSCAATSPKILKLSIEQLHLDGQTIELGIHLKNIALIDEIVQDRDPQRLFSARVTDSSGRALSLTKKGSKVYGPDNPNSVYFESSVAGPVTLQPGQELTLQWKIGDYFEFSKSGISKVQLKESIDLASSNTTVCSNILTIQVSR